MPKVFPLLLWKNWHRYIFLVMRMRKMGEGMAVKVVYAILSALKMRVWRGNWLGDREVCAFWRCRLFLSEKSGGTRANGMARLSFAGMGR